MSGSGPAPQRPAFTAEPFGQDGRTVLELGHHAVLGLSPGNRYFSVPVLTGLLEWLGERFARIDVVVPDSALEHTYRALGYESRRAAKKARGETNVLRNRAARAWQALGGPRGADGLHRMSDLASGDVYRERRAECERALADDPVLYETCAEMSREVLAARGGAGPPTGQALQTAMRYLVAELPFFLASADIFGAPSSLNFYHRRLPLAELVFSGGSVLKAPPWQGYATVRPQEQEGEPGGG